MALLLTLACFKWAGLCVIEVCSSLLSLSLGQGAGFNCPPAASLNVVAN